MHTTHHDHRRGCHRHGTAFGGSAFHGTEFPQPPTSRRFGPHRHRGGQVEFAEPGHRGRRARRGQLRESVLRLLSEEPLNGYQIMASLAEKTLGEWRPSPGATYPCLAQLEDEGLVTANQADGPKVFSLTEQGRAALNSISAEPWSGVTGAHGHHSELFDKFRGLAITVRFAAQTGTPEQLAAIAAHLDSSRKTILSIIADTE